jgi:hypothetical protein
LPLVPFLSQINPVHAIPFYFSKINFNIIHLHLGLPSSFFPSGFPTKNPLCVPLRPHANYMDCPSHHTCLGPSNYIWQTVQVSKLRSSSLCSFLHLHLFHISLVQVFFLAPCSHIVYTKTTGKIIYS